MHHIWMLSKGGPTDEKNLVPLHPTCHRNAHAGLYGREDQVLGFRDRWFEFQSLLQDVRSAIKSNQSLRAARLLTQENLHEKSLFASSYADVRKLCEEVVSALPLRNAEQRVLKSRIGVLHAEMSYGIGDISEAYEFARASASDFAGSDYLKAEFNHARLIEAMMAGKLGKNDLEEELLERIGEEAAVLDSGISTEWVFRYAAFLNQTGRPDQGRRFAEERLQGDEVLPKRQSAGLLGELGMAQLLCGDVFEAKRTLQSALEVTIDNAHPRGVCVRHYALAKLLVDQKDFTSAIHHFSSAEWLNNFVGRPVSPQLRELDRTLVRELGRNYMNELRTKHLL